MATIRKQVMIATAPDAVWAAFRDFHAVHEKVARGFVVAAEPEGAGVRHVTFANGLKAREDLISCNDELCRLAYTASGGRLVHHNGVFEVRPRDEGALVVWTLDVLPDEMASAIETIMEAGCEAMLSTMA
ncbi:MAG: SRPBCC family protein [Pseudomonadota bacterium]